MFIWSNKTYLNEGLLFNKKKKEDNIQDKKDISISELGSIIKKIMKEISEEVNNDEHIKNNMQKELDKIVNDIKEDEEDWAYYAKDYHYGKMPSIKLKFEPDSDEKELEFYVFSDDEIQEINVLAPYEEIKKRFYNKLDKIDHSYKSHIIKFDIGDGDEGSIIIYIK